MTDSARDGSPDGVEASAGVPQPPRTMADITRLFMAGAARGATRPLRQPPTTGAPASAVKAAPADARASASAYHQPGAVQPMPVDSISVESMAAESMSNQSAHSSDAPDDESTVERTGSFRNAAVTVDIALQDSGGAPGYAALLEAARRIASYKEAVVGLVAYDGEYLRVISIAGGHGSAPAAPPLTFSTAPAGADVQIARTLYRLRSTVTRWIIALPRMDEHLARSMLASSAHWLLVSGADSDSLIGSYRTLKGVCGLISENSGRPAAVRLLVQNADEAEQTRVHARLNQVARGFLEQELERIILNPARPVPLQAALALRVQEMDASAVVAAWYAVLDFVQEITGSTLLDDEQYSPDPDEPTARHEPRAADRPPVEPRPEQTRADCSIDIDAEPLDDMLDEEQRAAIAECMADVLASGQDAAAPDHTQAAAAAAVPNAPLEETSKEEAHEEASEEEAPYSEPRTIVSAPAAAPSESVPETSAESMLPREVQSAPRRAIHLAGVTSRQALWRALAPAVRELIPDLRVLAAAAPFAECTLLIDSAGRLHVAVLADETALGWLGLWQWATQQRSLLALTRGAENLDVSAAAQMHVILPAGGRNSPHGLPPDIHVYRLEPIWLLDQTAAVIVPLS